MKTGSVLAFCVFLTAIFLGPVHLVGSATELKMVTKPSVPITAGVGVTIKCETDSSNSGSPGTISWYRNGQHITSGVTPSTRQASDGGAIYISQLTFTARKEDNQAKYECKINDQASFRKDVTITVNSAPNIRLTVAREDNQVTASWPKLFKKYTKIQIKFCPREGGSCGYHDVADPTSLRSSFPVKEGKSYKYSMIIFDGDDQVFVSPVVVAPTPSNPPMAAIGGGVPGGVIGFLAFLVIIAVVLETVFILKKRRVEKDSGREATGPIDTLQTPANARDHAYMNVVNRAFESDEDALNHDEPFYVNFPQNLPPVQGEDDGTDLAKPEDQDGNVFVKCEPGARESYLLDRNKVYVVTEPRHSSAQGGAECVAEPGNYESDQDQPGDREERIQVAEEGAHRVNPYEELDITPDVIADQVYTKIKPWEFSSADG